MSDNQTALQQYVTFSLGPEIYAVNVTRAREILDDVTITPVPQTPGFMLGVINLRGNVVPVIDLRRKLGMAATERTVETCVIIMEIALDGESVVVGALVDSVREVIEIDTEQIEPPPRLGSSLRTEFIQGMGKVDDRFVIILDIDRVFSADEIALVQQLEESAPGDRRASDAP